MKIQLFALCALFSVCAHAKIEHDMIKKAIKDHNPEKLTNFSVKEVQQLANQKFEYAQLASEATQAAKSDLQRRFDWKDRMRFVSGLALSGAGIYLLNSFRKFLGAMNYHSYFDDNGQAYVKEASTATELLKMSMTGPLGALCLVKGIKECSKGLSKHDRKQAVVRSLFVKDAIEELGTILS